MPELANSKEEMFCRYIVRGETQIQAYTLAGYSFNRGNASEKYHQPHIKQRIAELQKEKADVFNTEIEELEGKSAGSVSELGLSETWVLQQLMITALLAKRAGQHNATKGALELIGMELGMFDSKKKKKGDATEEAREAISKKRKKIDFEKIAQFAVAEVNKMDKQDADVPSEDTDPPSAQES